jgi:hypothetical protein
VPQIPVQYRYLATRRLPVMPWMTWAHVLSMAGTFLGLGVLIRKQLGPSLRRDISCPVGRTGSIPVSFHHTALVSNIAQSPLEIFTPCLYRHATGQGYHSLP